MMSARMVRIAGILQGVRDKPDIVLADGDCGTLSCGEGYADHFQRRVGEGDMVGVARGVLDHVGSANEARDELRFRPVIDVFRRAELVDLATVHHSDQIGGRHCARLVVGDEMAV
jgi:hypothetical protein